MNRHLLSLAGGHKEQLGPEVPWDCCSAASQWRRWVGHLALAPCGQEGRGLDAGTAREDSPSRFGVNICHSCGLTIERECLRVGGPFLRLLSGDGLMGDRDESREVRESIDSDLKKKKIKK